MTKPSIALADLLEKGADTDLLREMTTHIVERVMQFDVENLCAAGYGERMPERQNSRNGYREPLWETRAGLIAVKIPTSIESTPNTPASKVDCPERNMWWPQTKKPTTAIPSVEPATIL